MRTVFLLIHSLGYAGRSAAVLDQSRMFVNLGLKPVIVTFKYEPRFDEDLRTRSGDFALPPGVSALNIYRHMRAPFTKDPEAKWSAAFDEDRNGLSVSTAPSGSGIRRDFFDHAGRTTKQQVVVDNQTTKTVFYRDGLPAMQRDYEDTGACGRERTLDPASGKTTEERYFTPDGFCYVTRHLDPHTGRQLGVYTHNPTTGESTRFAHNTPWHAAWLTELLTAEEERPLVVAQHPTAMMKLLSTDKSLSSQIYLSHVNLFQEPYSLGADLRPDYAQPFKRVDEMPVVAALTEAQASDMRETFGKEKCDPVVIPNVVRDRRTRSDIETVPGRIGIVCRLHPEQKRVDDLLRAWVHVVEAVPHAQLQIGGDGQARKALEELTKELGLTENVTFLGWLDESVDLMATCVATVSTGRSEGFGLSIGESLAAGTPVVSYDINYGPSDLIRHGKDGLLIPDGDVGALADGIIALLRDEQQAAKMGASGAQRVAEEFSMAAITPRWRAAFELADRAQ